MINLNDLPPKTLVRAYIYPFEELALLLDPPTYHAVREDYEQAENLRVTDVPFGEVVTLLLDVREGTRDVDEYPLQYVDPCTHELINYWFRECEVKIVEVCDASIHDNK